MKKIDVEQKIIMEKKNPFYGKKHSEESKKKMGGAVKDYNGERNPFYGKKHSKDTIETLRKKLKGKLVGDKNPFYGKSHSEDSIFKIKKQNEKYRDENKELTLQRQLKRLGLTEEILRENFLEYKNSEINSDDLQKKVGVDKRVFFKYIKMFGLATEEEISKIKGSKKMRRSKSSAELKIYDFLCEKYGKENIVWSHKIKNYFYDFFIFDSILIECDGYYWHNFHETNDDIKTALAKELGIPLIRILEPESRKTDFKKEFKRISEVINEIQTSRNKV